MLARKRTLNFVAVQEIDPDAFERALIGCMKIR